jgi:hypothetical protein
MMHNIVSITFPGAPMAKWLQVLHLIWVANSTGVSGCFNQGIARRNLEKALTASFSHHHHHHRRQITN